MSRKRVHKLISASPHESQSVGRLVGERVAVLRVERRMSLRRLAEGTGLTPSFLSKLERGQTSVSVDNLRNLARFLCVDMVQLLGEWRRESVAVVTRKGAGTRLKIANTSANIELLVPISRSVLQVTLHRTLPGRGRTVGFSHPGDEVIYVLSGRIRYWVGEDEFVLNEGDIIWHPSTQPHRYEVIGKKPGIALHVNTPPVWFHLGVHARAWGESPEHTGSSRPAPSHARQRRAEEPEI